MFRDGRHMTAPLLPQDRRTDARFSLHIIGTAEALYRRALAAAYQDASLKGQERFKTETINVSNGGMMLAFDPDMNIGDVLRVMLRHPKTKDELAFEVQIQWLRKNAITLMGKYCAGVSFKNRDEALIESLMSYAASVHAPPAP